MTTADERQALAAAITLLMARGDDAIVRRDHVRAREAYAYAATLEHLLSAPPATTHGGGVDNAVNFRDGGHHTQRPSGGAGRGGRR